MKPLLILILSLTLSIAAFGQNEKHDSGSMNKANDSLDVRREYQFGKLFRETPYSKGKINGIVKQYSDKGILWIETPYINGRRNGIGKFYFENGNIQEEVTYSNGKVVGKKRYYISKKLEEIVTYDTSHNGVMKAKKYFEDGKLNYESEQTTEIYWIKIYDENGKLTKQANDSIKNIRLAPVKPIE